jgi:membrane protein insertase Oxa1/YidC/SpoIIIJ
MEWGLITMDLYTIWNEFLVRPFFNIMIWLYNVWAAENLGTAIILLTIGLRVALLPISILALRSKTRAEALQQRLKELVRDFKGDRVAVKEEVRRLMKVYKLRPWAKAVSLGVQGLALVILYQVFLTGLKGELLVHTLYSWVDFPGRINLDFFGFNIGDQNFYWALAVGIILFLEIYYEQEKSRHKSRRELWYAILFPVASVVVLTLLPMVKSLFILTSMAFSGILIVVQKLLLRENQES